MLVLTCEYLTGVVVATDVANRERAEWPPHPARLYSAMVSAWGEGGASPHEREALAALETLGPPDVHAPEGSRRTVADHFVPVNDTSLGGRKSVGDGAVGLLPSRRNRQARTFPSIALPDDRREVHFVWVSAEVSPHQRAVLEQIATRVSYLGHSRSLVRLAVSESVPEDLLVWRPSPQGTQMLRVPTPGRLDELETLYMAGQRPTVGSIIRYSLAPTAGAPSSGALAGPWITLRFAGGLIPAMEAWPYVAWMLRRALVRSVDTLLGAELTREERETVLSVISGHQTDGSPLQTPHAAYVPLANVGFGRYSSGLLLGAAIALPSDAPHVVGDAVRAAITRAMVETPDADTNDQRAFMLRLGVDGTALLALADDDPRRSLSAARYIATSRVWTSVTPVVLDRFPRGPSDVPDVVLQACRHAGLPDPVHIEAHKHSACAGAPPARPKLAGPSVPGAWRTAWRDEHGNTGERFGSRPLTHVTLTFDVPVRGTVLVGAGRYHGLGLCVPAIGEAL
jgi:CRISPR-associated protein Csb2